MRDRVITFVMTTGVTFALGLIAFAPGVLGFGTVNFAGQTAQHEKITRAALQCAPGYKPPDAPKRCFEALTMDELAGTSYSFPHLGTFGAVGAPDVDSFFEDSPHCTDADFLNTPTYPRTRAQATQALLTCIGAMKIHFNL